MKVLFIVNIPSPYRVDFFNELGKLCDLTVLYEKRNASDREWSASSAVSFREVFLRGLSTRADAALSMQIIKYLKDDQYDVIVIGGYSTPTGMLATEYLSLKNIPYILSTDGGYIKDESKAIRRVKKHFISKASAWLSTSKVTDKYLCYYGANQEQIYRYPFTSLFERDILKKTLEYNEKKQLKVELGIEHEQVVVAVGQFIHRKGYDVLLQACGDICSNVGVYIIGGTPTDEYLLIHDKYNLKNVYYLPFQEKEVLKKYYMSSDIFVLPTREDIWGLVINEAMAAGLPIVTTDKCIAGVELVKDGFNGYIVPSNNEKAIAEKINAILNNNSLRHSMSEHAIETISTYTLENMAKEHIRIFNKILS